MSRSTVGQTYIVMPIVYKLNQGRRRRKDVGNMWPQEKEGCRMSRSTAGGRGKYVAAGEGRIPTGGGGGNHISSCLYNHV